MKPWIVTFFCVLVTVFVKGQDFAVHSINYGLDDGLPSSQCYEIIQDAKGYIWFGTDRGVVKYNGYEFQTFTTEDGLNNDVVYYLEEDRYGRIWCYDKTNQLTCISDSAIFPYPYNDILKENGTEHWKMLDFQIDEKGTFYFSCQSHKENHPIKHIDQNGKATFLEAKDAKIYLYLNNGLPQMVTSTNANLEDVHYEVDHNKVYKIRSNVLKYTGVSGLPRFFSSDSSIVFSWRDIIFRLDKYEIKALYTFNEGIIELEQDQQGSIYVGVNNHGLFFFPKGDFKKPVHLLEDCSISSILIDSDGGVWASTLSKGLYYIPNKESMFLKKTMGKPINNITGNDNAIIYCFKTGEIHSIFPNAILKNSLSFYSYIYDLTYHKKVGFIACLNGRNILNYRNINDSPIEMYGVGGDWTFTEYNLYSARSSYIYRYSLKEDESISLAYSDDLNRDFKCISTSFQKGALLLGSKSGLFHFKKDTIIQYRKEVPEYHSEVSDLVFWENQLLISATRAHGLVVETRDSAITFIQEDDGLISNNITRLKQFGSKLYAISKKGLSIIEFKGQDHKINIQNYTQKNGILSNEINDVFARDDTIWVATNKGLTRLVERGFDDLVNTHAISLKMIEILGEKQPLKNDFELTSSQDELKFSYEVLDYSALGQVIYQYKLEGLDKDWKQTKVRELTYSRIPSGDFEFKIRYRKRDNTWSATTRLFQFTKHKPFYQTIWFIVCVCLAIGSLIWGLVKRRDRKMKSELAVKKKMIDLERRALQAQMSPHFTFNALTSIQNLIAQNKNEKAESFLVSFSRLVRTALNHSSSDIFISLKEELDLLHNYLKLEALRFEDAFHSQIILEDILEKGNIYIPPMMIQPFIENAIEHGLLKLNKRGELHIYFQRENEHFVKCIVEDNGIGMEASMKFSKRKGRESKGVNLVKDRLFLLDKSAEISIEEAFPNLENPGTKVTLLIPYKNKIT